MPRISNFSKEDIVKAGLELVREKGEESLSARNLSSKLGCSTSPLFTVFGSFEEVKDAVRDAAADVFNEFVADSVNYTPAFKEYGMRLIRFAREDQNLFKMLFLNTGSPRVRLNDSAKACLAGVKSAYGLVDDEVEILFTQVWVFTCGMSMLSASGAVNFMDEEISLMLSRQFIGTMSVLKSGNAFNDIKPHLRQGNESMAVELPKNI